MTLQKENNYVSNDAYYTLMKSSPIPTIDILFFNPKKTHTLLGKRVNNPYKDVFYAFGGRLQKNETFEKAVVRIVKKETEIDLKISDLYFGGVDNEISSSSVFEDTNYHAVILYFGCVIQSDTEVTLDDQHSESKWVDIDDKEIHPSIRTRITNSLKAIQTNS